MKIFFLLLILFPLFYPMARAEDRSVKLDLASQLLDAMDFCVMMDRGLEDMKNNQIKQIKTLGDRGGVANNHDVERTFELIREAMDCDTLKADTADIYADLFTENELRGLVDFYQSEVGKSFSLKQPEMMKRSMEVSMKRMQKIMPQIMQKVQQEKLEAQKAPADQD